MDLNYIQDFRHRCRYRIRFQKIKSDIFLIACLILSFIPFSCDPNPHESNWFDDDIVTIGEYLDRNQHEYSKFYRVLEEGKMLRTLCGYNPYGEGYTLFLPTNEAVDHFIAQHPDYNSFEDLLTDTSFLYTLARYHTLNNKLHTYDFPFGALTDLTLTGERLTIGFYTEKDNALYKVNDNAPIINANLEMTNGYIHVLSEVLQQADVSGYEWLQQAEDYSILAQAMELSGIDKNLWYDQYSIFAEHDTVYSRNGINNIEELIERLSTPGTPYTDPSNPLYQFTAYHILYGEYYLNDFSLGSASYRTMGDERVTVDVGLDIQINPGVDTFEVMISESGDTAVIDYIRLLWNDCNILTSTGPVHAISDLLVAEPFPQ